MANIFGTEFLSADELRSQQNEQFEAAKARFADNPQVAQAVRIQQGVFNAFGSPELRKAKERDKALRAALESVTKDEEESELEFQARQAETVRNRLMSIDPTLAVAANDAVIKAKNAMLERRKLLAGAEKAELSLEEAKSLAEMSKKRILFEIDPQTGARTPLKDLSGLGVSEIADEVQKAKGEGKLVDVGSGADLVALEGDRPISKAGRVGDSGSDVITPSQRGNYLKAIDDAASFARAIPPLVNDMLDANDINALATGGRTAAAGSGLFGLADRFQNEFEQEVPEEQRDGVVADAEAKIQSGINSYINRNNVTSERARELADTSSASFARVKALAYKLAKTLDPGGRLSDQDVEMAIEMLVGSGSPSVLRRLLQDRLNESRASVRTAIMFGEGGLLTPGSPVGMNAIEAYNEEFERAAETLADLAAEVATARARRTGETETNVGKPGEPSPAGGDEFIEFTIRGVR